MLLVGNENFEKKTYLWSKFCHHGNDTVNFEIYTTNHIFYHYLVSLIKWVVKVLFKQLVHMASNLIWGIELGMNSVVK